VGIAVRVLLWLAVTVAVVGAGVISTYGLFRVFVTANPHFTLESIDIEATPTIDQKTVRDIVAEMGVREQETNLLTVDIEAVRERLEQEVVIDRATVVRRLPDTLVISLYERHPVAQLHCKPKRLIDDDGTILPWWQTGDAALLPEITGIRDPKQLKPGAKAEDEALLGALSFLRRIRSRPEGVLYDVAIIQLDYYLPSLRVHLRERDTFRNGAVIVIPVKGMEAALDRLRDVVRLRSDANQTTSLIDATYERNLRVLP
jgi:cell division septal protein FtsQ